MPTLQRFTARNAQLLVVDLQERLLPVVSGHALVQANTARLIQAAELLQIPTVATVQYPKGLGPTVERIASLLKWWSEGRKWKCFSCGSLFDRDLRRIK